MLHNICIENSVPQPDDVNQDDQCDGTTVRSESDRPRNCGIKLQHCRHSSVPVTAAEVAVRSADDSSCYAVSSAAEEDSISETNDYDYDYDDDAAASVGISATGVNILDKDLSIPVKAAEVAVSSADDSSDVLCSVKTVMMKTMVTLQKSLVLCALPHQLNTMMTFL